MEENTEVQRLKAQLAKNEKARNTLREQLVSAGYELAPKLQMHMLRRMLFITLS